MIFLDHTTNSDKISKETHSTYPKQGTYSLALSFLYPLLDYWW